MSRRPATVTQADVHRVIKAAKQAGAGVVEIKPDGTIRVLLCHPNPPLPSRKGLRTSVPWCSDGRHAPPETTASAARRQPPRQGLLV
ncbi:hypothetical protein BRADO3262 [Bradyrhizobium sp. ORS 278]|nr:hypothetical protein BRADO3262 [Bradyrhizobium sp. ORS 278]